MSHNNHLKIVIRAESADLPVIYRLFVNKQLMVERYVPVLSVSERIAENIILLDQQVYRLLLQNITDNGLHIDDIQLNDNKINLRPTGFSINNGFILENFVGTFADKAVHVSCKNNK
jgi:hypothetical protein